MNLLTVLIAFALLTGAGAIAYRRFSPVRRKARVFDTPSRYWYD